METLVEVVVSPSAIFGFAVIGLFFLSLYGFYRRQMRFDEMAEHARADFLEYLQRSHRLVVTPNSVRLKLRPYFALDWFFLFFAVPALDAFVYSGQGMGVAYVGALLGLLGLVAIRTSRLEMTVRWTGDEFILRTHEVGWLFVRSELLFRGTALSFDRRRRHQDRPHEPLYVANETGQSALVLPLRAVIFWKPGPSPAVVGALAASLTEWCSAAILPAASNDRCPNEHEQ